MLTDCFQVFSLWSQHATKDSYVLRLIRDIRAMTRSFPSFEIVFVRRLENTTVDFLARYAFHVPFTVWIEEGPVGLNRFLFFDVQNGDYSN